MLNLSLNIFTIFAAVLAIFMAYIVKQINRQEKGKK